MVIASNTFTQYWEVYRYIKVAFESNYSVFIFNTSQDISDEVLEQLNVHGVPKAKITSMRERFKYMKSGSWNTEEVTQFLIDENVDLIDDHFVGLNIDLTAVLKAAELMCPLLNQFSMSTLVAACSALRKRNANYRHPFSSGFHLTILPRTARKLSPSEKALLCNIIYHSVVVQIDGCGYVQDLDGNVAMYFTVDEAGILPIRSFLTGCGFQGDEWSPHITIGFKECDIHEVRKPKLFSAAPSQFSQDEMDLCQCLLHPSVKLKAKCATDGTEFVDISVVAVPGLSDDLTYSRNPELLSLVPRGLVYALTKAESDSADRWTCVLRGITKFTGTLGNDDDLELPDSEASELLSSLSSEATHFRASKKENGRSGGFSVVRRPGPGSSLYQVCVGTKLSHLLVPYDSSSNTFEVESAWLEDPNMRMITRNILAYQDLFSCCERTELLACLSRKTSTTLNCEILDHEDQHIERIPEGCLTAVCLNVVVDGRYSPALLEELQRLGARTVSVGPLHPMAALDEQVRRMKAGRTEGYVLQFFDAAGSVTGLLKVKCLWYIAVRAIREVTRSRLLAARHSWDTNHKDAGKKLDILQGLISRQTDPTKLERYTQQRNEELEKMEQLRNNWYTTKAEEAFSAIRLTWRNKFDFLRAEVDGLEEKVDQIIELAGSFLRWYGQKLDGRIQSSETFSSTFAVIWDEFIADGHDESFLLLKDLL